MRVSDFWNRMDEEFGRAYAGSLSKSLVLAALDDWTVVEAVERGANLRQVWHAVCDAMDVPATRRGFEPRPDRQGPGQTPAPDRPVPAKIPGAVDTNS